MVDQTETVAGGSVAAVSVEVEVAMGMATGDTRVTFSGILADTIVDREASHHIRHGMLGREAVLDQEAINGVTLGAFRRMCRRQMAAVLTMLIKVFRGIDNQVV
eukprot:GHVS01019908.1.p2 GENE.GHVS01019908.1~~GHVS01019908.1.p2  ORF type:complete len:104 (+),score=5.16 GHVS01019908.1:594-905(+)